MMGRGAAALLWVLAGGMHPGTADLAGRWRLEFQRDGAPTTYLADCLWEQEGTRLSGACSSGFESLATVTGAVVEPTVTLQLTYGAENSIVMTFDGRFGDGVIRGTWRSVDGAGSPAGTGTFTSSRQ